MFASANGIYYIMSWAEVFAFFSLIIGIGYTIYFPDSRYGGVLISFLLPLLFFQFHLFGWFLGIIMSLICLFGIQLHNLIMKPPYRIAIILFLIPQFLFSFKLYGWILGGTLFLLSLPVIWRSQRRKKTIQNQSN